MILNINTVTPLLKRMESRKLIRRIRSGSDERKLMVELTEKGKVIKEQAAGIPEKLLGAMITGPVEMSELSALKSNLNAIIRHLSEKES